MWVFRTGATGWGGSAVIKELVDAGHQVTGLVRSDEKAVALAAIGAGVLRGTLQELDTLRHAASLADAVIHTTSRHDSSKFVEGCEQDRRAIEVLGSALEGSDRPLLVTMGIAMLAPGQVATETDVFPPDLPLPRKS